jgi:hypothetical protein
MNCSKNLEGGEVGQYTENDVSMILRNFDIVPHDHTRCHNPEHHDLYIYFRWNPQILNKALLPRLR